MNDQETRSLLSIALLAAYADGANDEREREAVKRAADSLGADAGLDLPALYAQVVVSKPDIAQVAAGLQTPDVKQLAYEMAVGVCEADGSRSPAESDFLARLASVLDLPASVTGNVHDAADALSDAAANTAATEVPASSAASATGTVVGRPTLSAAEMDETILKASITNAAIELLPEAIASMAVIPLQMRLVYRIGRSFGYPMDMSNAKDFLATLGIGLAGQYLEQFGRRLLGGLLGGIGGGLGRAIGRQAASSGMTFATTYAIGRVAQRFYAAGRTIDAAALKQTFLALLDEAKGIAPRYQDQIARASSTINVGSLASLIKQA